MQLLKLSIHIHQQNIIFIKLLIVLCYLLPDSSLRIISSFLTDLDSLDRYARNFVLKGGGGTDFRPAFEYVDSLIETGEYMNLKGLIYFTDGYGIYPNKMPPYRTAFVFSEEDYRDTDVPPWAIRLVLSEESLRESGA